MSAFDIGCVSQMEKIAKETTQPLISETEKAMMGVGGVGVGGIMIGESRFPIVGTKRMFHGTSKANWDKIKREGFDPARGGKAGGASVIDGGEDFIRDSYGKVHVGSSSAASSFKKMHGKNSKKIKIDLEWDDWKNNFEIDPEGSSKNTAARSSRPIRTRNIHGAAGRDNILRRAVNRVKKMPGYIKKNPKRFLTGIGMLGAGTLLTGGSAYSLKHQYDNRKNR